MLDIERLKKEIDMQTRNGRKEVYIRMEDIKELCEGMAGYYGDNRMMIEADYILELIDKYEKENKNNAFKDSLKVNVDTKMVSKTGHKYKYMDIERGLDR